MCLIMAVCPEDCSKSYQFLSSVLLALIIILLLVSWSGHCWVPGAALGILDSLSVQEQVL